MRPSRARRPVLAMNAVGRRRQVVFPTLEFPSDHALVSAVFTARYPPPVDPGAAAAADSAVETVEAPPVAAWNSSSVASDGISAQSRVGGLSLYEYWGIADSAATIATVGGHHGGRMSCLSAAAAATAADDDDAAFDAEIDSVVQCDGSGDAAAVCAAAAARAIEAWFVRVGRRAKGGRDLDDWREELSRLKDRSMWIVFRPVATTIVSHISFASLSSPLHSILPTADLEWS